MAASSRDERVDTGRFWKRLRDIPAPDGDHDLVEAGMIDELDEADGVLSIHLVEDVCDDDAMIEVAGAIHQAFEDLESIRRVRVHRRETERSRHATRPDGVAAADADPGDGRPMTPLQAELMEEGRVPEPDPIGQSTTPPNMAPGAGYGDKRGPEPLDGPGGIDKEDARKAEYDGEMPVFQWEVDPHDPEADTGEANIEKEDWEFRIWWQNHPEGLTYASLRALVADDEDRGGEARPHAVGRAIVVNLVYDRDREGVIAVYGTTRDFRPFVDAFREGFAETDG